MDGAATDFGHAQDSGLGGALAAQIEKQWGSVEAFKAEFEAKGVYSIQGGG